MKPEGFFVGKENTVKIEVCRIAGFGALQNRTFSFEDGLNVLCLPNGAGKSTLAGFIKCMLYGLSDTKKQSVAENERKRFAPLGGGAFGGSMTFSSADGRFTIERTFGKRSSDDTFALTDAVTGRRSTRYPNSVGEALFGLDAEAFERVFFLSERELTGKNESVAERLSSPAERAGLSEGLTRALDRLEAERRRLAKRGGSGDIEDTERQIAALSAEIPTLRAQANDAAEAKRALSDIEETLRDPSGAAELRAAAKEERDRALKALKAEEAELLAFFRAGIPSSEELRAAEHAYFEEKEAKTKAPAPRPHADGKLSPSAAFLKKLRVPLFLLTLALGALGVAIGLSSSVFGYLLLLPAVIWILRFFVGKFQKNDYNYLHNINFATEFLVKYPFETGNPFDEIRKKIYRIEEVRRAIGARENEDYERVTSPPNVRPMSASEDHAKVGQAGTAPSLATLYRERATAEDRLKRAEEAAVLLEEKEGMRAALSEKLARDKARLALLLKTKELLLRADGSLADAYLSRVADGLSRYGDALGIAEGLSADGDLHLSEKRNGLSLPLELMSRGERALSKLALRFSLADAIGGEPSFLLLDDPFLAVDDEKIGRALGMLSALSKGRQVLYLTCSASRVP